MQIQHGKNAFVKSCLLYIREMLAVSFDGLASRLFLVIGGEIHGERELCYTEVFRLVVQFEMRMRVHKPRAREQQQAACLLLLSSSRVFSVLNLYIPR